LATVGTTRIGDAGHVISGVPLVDADVEQS